MKVELYNFDSSGSNWRFTSADRNLEYGSDVYTAVPGLKRGQIGSMGSIHKADLKIEAPRDNDLVGLFTVSRPESIVSTSIFEADYPVTEVNLIWKGRIVGVALKDSLATIACESIFTSLGRPGLRAMYQIVCRHGLYQAGCNLSSGDFAVSAAVSANDGLALTVPAAAGYEDGYFAGGYLTMDGQYVMIISHTGSAIGIDRPVIGTGAATLFPGCDHSITMCHGRFDNVLNFGGYPYIPGRTPFAGGQSFITAPSSSPNAAL